ncbi:MAG: hypothetical protein NVSMB20_05360 [Bradyrhizobium sp.]
MPKRDRRAVHAAKLAKPCEASPHATALERHHDVEKPGKASAVWRVKTRIDGLLAGGHITAGEWTAGDAYRRDYEMGECGANGREPGMISGGDGCPAQHQLDALARLRAARAILSPEETLAADLIVAQDAAWAELARQLWPAPPDLPAEALLAHAQQATMRARRLVQYALANLADAYATNGSGTRMRAA